MSLVHTTRVEVNEKQIDAIADLAEEGNLRGKIELKQTYSESGGTHLYVTSHTRKGGRSALYHIAAINGNVTVCDGEVAP